MNANTEPPTSPDIDTLVRKKCAEDPDMTYLITHSSHLGPLKTREGQTIKAAVESRIALAEQTDFPVNIAGMVDSVVKEAKLVLMYNWYTSQLASDAAPITIGEIANRHAVTGLNVGPRSAPTTFNALETLTHLIKNRMHIGATVYPRESNHPHTIVKITNILQIYLEGELHPKNATSFTREPHQPSITEMRRTGRLEFSI